MNESVLELRVGGVPFPHGDENGRWRYRHAVRPTGPTLLDHQVVADFIAYERDHGRTTTVEADAALADWSQWTPPTSRPNPTTFATQCCTHVFANGCAASGLVCHGAPPHAAAAILNDGELRSSAQLSGKAGTVLAAESSWGEPPDYFEYVMFANGRCTAPEAVANSRRLSRDLVPADLARGYTPAARFYFRWDQLVDAPSVAFDGVHPIKVRDALPLDLLLVAVVVPRSEPLTMTPHRSLADRIVVLDATAATPEEWADKSARAALAF
jgi:hypothetical protein